MLQRWYYIYSNSEGKLNELLERQGKQEEKSKHQL